MKFTNALLNFLMTIIISSSLFGILPSVANAYTSEADESQMNQKVARIVSTLTPEQKIGQMMFVGISGPKLNKSDKHFLKDVQVGGIILFDRNMRKPEQVKRLNAKLQKVGAVKLGPAAADTAKVDKLPLFIAVDMEGGLVARMKDKWPDGPIPSAEALGATNNPDNAKQWATKVAKSMKNMGFNVNFAPVADVGANRGRSFAKEHEKVTAFLNAAMAGYEHEKIISTLKHFPGIGRAVVDPHFDGSVIKEDLETLKKTDLVPFRTMIEQRDNNTFMIMISHLSYTAINKDLPSSVSPKIIKDLLKEQCGYKGLVITDDLEMGAVAKHFTFEEIGLRAINAGADMALVCHEPKYMQLIYDSLLKAYKEGQIRAERIDDCVSKIVRVKLANLE